MTHLLFIDDDAESLAALRARLHARRDRWDMTFAPSADVALGAAEHADVDLLVTDLRMPGTDGVELLKQFARRWPHTVRLVLSGDGDASRAASIVNVAHQHLTKPCGPGELEQTIERCLALRQLLHDPGLKRLMGRVERLPTLPRTYARLTSAIEDPRSDLKRIVSVVQSDSAVAARVLQLANSAFFGVPQRIARLDQAVARLGTYALRNLVLMVETYEGAGHCQSAGPLSLQAIRQHALVMAAACRALASPGQAAEEAFLAGMLQDIGYLVLLRDRGRQVGEAWRRAREDGSSRVAAERAVLGASHAEVGACLLGLWGLPHAIVEAVAWHHELETSPARESVLAVTVALAAALIEGDMPGEPGEQAGQAAAWCTRLGLSAEEARARVALAATAADGEAVP